VHGVKGNEGELFGLANLLRDYSDKVLTVELIREAEKCYNFNTAPAGDLSGLEMEDYMDDTAGKKQEEQEALNKALFADDVADDDPDLAKAVYG